MPRGAAHHDYASAMHDVHNALSAAKRAPDANVEFLMQLEHLVLGEIHGAHQAPGGGGPGAPGPPAPGGVPGPPPPGGPEMPNPMPVVDGSGPAGVRPGMKGAPNPDELRRILAGS